MMLALTDDRKCRYLYDEKLYRQSVWHLFANWSTLAKSSPSIATAEDLDRIFKVNVQGTFLCYKYAALQMIAQGRGGRIIGMPSMPLPVLRCSLWPGQLSYRRMLWHGQTGTSIIERLFCEQILYPRLDSIRW